MKKFHLTAFTAIAAVILAACGGNKRTDQKEDKETTAAVQSKSLKDILEIVKKEAERKGYKISIMEVSDDVTYNDTVQHNEADANFAQYQLFMKMSNRGEKADLVAAQPICYSVDSFYSKKYQDAKGLPGNAKAGIPSDPTNGDCTSTTLSADGVIKLKEDVGFNGTVVDIVKSPKNITFESIDLLDSARAYDEKDTTMMFCYPTRSEPAGLTAKDTVLLEDEEANKHHALQVVTRKGKKDNEKIKILKEAITTKEVARYVKKNFKGVNIPAF